MGLLYFAVGCPSVVDGALEFSVGGNGKHAAYAGHNEQEKQQAGDSGALLLRDWMVVFQLPS